MDALPRTVLLVNFPCGTFLDTISIKHHDASCLVTDVVPHMLCIVMLCDLLINYRYSFPLEIYKIHIFRSRI